MFKLMQLNKCTMCTSICSQTVLRTISNNCEQHDPDQVKTDLSRLRKSFEFGFDRGGRKKRMLSKINRLHIQSVVSILEKYSIDTNRFHKANLIFRDSPWRVEKKIMLLKELGVPTVTPSLILNFRKGLSQPVHLFKANTQIEVDDNLAKNLFSSIKMPYNERELDNLNDHLPLKMYYNECLQHYLHRKLKLTNSQLKRISLNDFGIDRWNSFNLLERLLEYITSELNYSTAMIVKNYWLLRLHPGQAEENVHILREKFKDDTLKLLQKCPKILDYVPSVLQTYLSYFDKYEITPEMVMKIWKIFQLSPQEFKSRIECLLKRPMVLVLRNHPRFLALVRDYSVVLPRLTYLEENNLHYATINTLITYHNYAEQLTAKRKVLKRNLISLLQLQFGDDAQELFKVLKKHPCYDYVPCSEMYETLSYLKECFPKQTIYKHIYASLYNRTKLKNMHETLLKNPSYCKLSSHQLLALCIYKLEEESHFSGEGVLNTEKPIESLYENSAEDDEKEENMEK